MEFKAAVLRAFGTPLAVEPVRLAQLDERDVVVRMVATSLCHTDLEAQEGSLRCPLPIVPGHEAAGVVEWIGTGVSRVAVGDHVVLSWNPTCGQCFYCQRGQSILCQPYRDGAARAVHFDGRPRLFMRDEPVHQLMYAGTFAELAVVTEDCAVRIPREMPLDRACLLGCGVMTGVGAVLNVARVEVGASVSVIGCGAVGLSAVQGARLAGAAVIVAIDRDPGRLELARRLGATHALAAGDDLADRHAVLTQGRGADYVFEAAGSPAAFGASLEIVRPGGRVVWLGKLEASRSLPLRWGSLMGEKQIVRSSYGGARPEHDFPYLAQAYLDGRLLLDEYLGSRIGLHDINTGLARLRRGEELRPVVTFS